jgi:hypothetical protein
VNVNRCPHQIDGESMKINMHLCTSLDNKTIIFMKKIQLIYCSGAVLSVKQPIPVKD